MEVNMIELKGQSVIVTGGANGIGRQICLEFAKAGANVAVADIDFVKAQEVANEVLMYKVKSIAIHVDVANANSVNSMVDKTIEAFGAIDVICNNAGICTMIDVESMSEDDWDIMMNINAKGVFLCSKAVIPQMKKQGHGRIINAASRSSKEADELFAHYCASKAAVMLFTRALALELAKYNILVNCVCPGNVWTDMMVRESIWIHERTGRPIEDIKNEWQDNVPLKRYATPLDVARIYVFLASEYADYLTGDSVNVTGGLTMY
jgi:NAD(P)-dependent dehydrogenase (short-subunit alcohol dehydrogenase family)